MAKDWLKAHPRKGNPGKRVGLWLVLWPLALGLTWSAQGVPFLIEEGYSLRVYLLISQALSRFTGVLPFSLAELLVAFLVLFIPILMIRALLSLSAIPLKDKGLVFRSALTATFLRWLIWGGILYFLFVTLWGLNYYRQPLAEMLGYAAEGGTRQELLGLTEALIQRANSLREGLPEDAQGVMNLPGGFDQVRIDAPQAYAQAQKKIPQLGGEYGMAKPILLSGWLSYTGITGIYFPYTGEANVNVHIPRWVLPATTCHEMAHQRGFAREDECNYIAWVTCNSSERRDFRYSGTMLALLYALNALYQQSPDEAMALQKAYSAGVGRDLQHYASYWKQYEGKVSEVASDVNDVYLKSNRQTDGIQSYGRMVDLLLAEKRDPVNTFLR